MAETKYLFKPYNGSIMINNSPCKRIIVNGRDACKVMVNNTLNYENHLSFR